MNRLYGPPTLAAPLLRCPPGGAIRAWDGPARAFACCVGLLCVAPLAVANDFPTRARVDYVLSCMQDNRMSPQESMYKCSCAIDAIAAKVRYRDWVDLSTVANGVTIAGERGGVMRDLKDARKLIGSYRKLQDDAKRQCFIPTQ